MLEKIDDKISTFKLGRFFPDINNANSMRFDMIQADFFAVHLEMRKIA